MRMLLSVLAIGLSASVAQAALVNKVISCTSPVNFPGSGNTNTSDTSYSVNVNRIVAQKAYVMTVVSSKALPIPAGDPTDPSTPIPFPQSDDKTYQERVTLTQSTQFGSATVFKGKELTLTVLLSEQGMPGVLKRGSQVLTRVYCQTP